MHVLDLFSRQALEGTLVRKKVLLVVFCITMFCNGSNGYLRPLSTTNLDLLRLGFTLAALKAGLITLRSPWNGTTGMPVLGLILNYKLIHTCMIIELLVSKCIASTSAS